MAKRQNSLFPSKDEELRILKGLQRQDAQAEAEFCETYLPVFLHFLNRWGIPCFDEISNEAEQTILEQKFLDDKYGIANDAFVQIFRQIRKRELVVKGRFSGLLKAVVHGKYVDYLCKEWHNPTLQKLYNQLKEIQRKEKALLKEARRIEEPYKAESFRKSSTRAPYWEEVTSNLRVFVTDLDLEKMPESKGKERRRVYQALESLYEKEEELHIRIIEYEDHVRIRTSLTKQIVDASPSVEEQVQRQETKEEMRKTVNTAVEEEIRNFSPHEQSIIAHFYRMGEAKGRTDIKKLARDHEKSEKEVKRIVQRFRRRIRKKT